VARAPGVHWLQLKTRATTRNYAGSSIISTGVSQTAAIIPSQVLGAIVLQPSTSIIAVAGVTSSSVFPAPDAQSNRRL
jgi:hypothetical protein